MSNRLKIKELQEGVSLTGLGTLLFGFIYVSGYLVNALYVRSRGIAPLPLLKAQYIETGLVFVILTGLLAAIPILIGQMAIHGRLKHDQKITPTIIIPIIVTTNFLLILLFWAIFVTEFEWEATSTFLGIDIKIKRAFPLYLLSMLLILPALPIIRMADFSQRTLFIFPRLSPDIDNTLNLKPINLIVQILRFMAVIFTILFDAILVKSIPWFPKFISMGLYYVVTVAILIGGMYLVRYLSGIFGETKHRAAVWCVGIPLLLMCYYFSATAYSYVIYNNIPVSRGGKYPTTKAELTFSGNAQSEMPKQVYVLEETNDTLYVVPISVQNWFTSHTDVLAIPRSEVIHYRLVHLSTGEPRINHLKLKAYDSKPTTK